MCIILCLSARFIKVPICRIRNSGVCTEFCEILCFFLGGRGVCFPQDATLLAQEPHWCVWTLKYWCQTVVGNLGLLSQGRPREGRSGVFNYIAYNITQGCHFGDLRIPDNPFKNWAWWLPAVSVNFQDFLVNQRAVDCIHVAPGSLILLSTLPYVQHTWSCLCNCILHVLFVSQIDILQAEVTALKALVITSTPSMPNRHLHPQLEPRAGSAFVKGHRRSTSHHNFNQDVLADWTESWHEPITASTEKSEPGVTGSRNEDDREVTIWQ